MTCPICDNQIEVFQGALHMCKPAWKPTWHPQDLEAGLEAWLRQPHVRSPQGSDGLDISRADPDYRRWAFMLSAVTLEVS